MTNDELIIAIAKAKGMNAGVVCEWDDIYGTHHTEDYAGDREWYPAGTPIYYTENGVFYPLPDWPNDIAAAWELFDELPVYKSIECARHDGRPKPVIWECHVNGVGNFVANTAPIVICLAWLAWKEGQK